KLIAELGGTSAGSGYDQINLAGAAELAGALDVELINSFTPSVGNSFLLLSAANGIRGTFDTSALPDLPTYGYWQLAYGANDLRLSVLTTRPWHNSPNPMDVTGDGHIVPADALAVTNYINAFGSSTVPASAMYGVPFYD